MLSLAECITNDNLSWMWTSVLQYLPQCCRTTQNRRLVAKVFIAVDRHSVFGATDFLCSPITWYQFRPIGWRRSRPNCKIIKKSLISSSKDLCDKPRRQSPQIDFCYMLLHCPSRGITCIIVVVSRTLKVFFCRRRLSSKEDCSAIGCVEKVNPILCEAEPVENPEATLGKQSSGACDTTYAIAATHFWHDRTSQKTRILDVLPGTPQHDWFCCGDLTLGSLFSNRKKMLQLCRRKCF